MKEMKKILFIGYAVGAEYETWLNGISIAGNKMQNNVIKGISKDSRIDSCFITIFPIAPYPVDKKLFISEKEILLGKEIKSHRVSFLNFPIIKQLMQIINVFRQAKKFVDKETIVLTYNLSPQTGVPSKWLKRKYGCRICTIFADPPDEIDYEKKNVFLKIRWKIYHALTMRCIEDCDEFITLNEYAIRKYAPTKRYLLMEGGYDTKKLKRPLFKEKKSRNIIYSGILTEYSGILTLIKAMDFVEDMSVQLEIYGKGPLEKEVSTLASSMKNVSFCGVVDNDTMMKIQREAFLLINPRKSDNAISKVTFPSKMFEYMASGTPTLVTKLNSFSEEYLSCLFIVENESPEGFADVINKVCGMHENERINMARRAYEFITKEKNWDKQNERIINFLLQ